MRVGPLLVKMVKYCWGFLLSFVEIRQTGNLISTYLSLCNLWDIQFFFCPVPVLRLLEYIGFLLIVALTLFWADAIQLSLISEGSFIDLHGNIVSCHFPALSASVIAVILHPLVFQLTVPGMLEGESSKTTMFKKGKVINIALDHS